MLPLGTPCFREKSLLPNLISQCRSGCTGSVGILAEDRLHINATLQDGVALPVPLSRLQKPVLTAGQERLPEAALTTFEVPPAGQTALHRAADSGDVPTIAQLLQCGADIALCDAAGRAPIATAAFAGRTTAVLYLSLQGADASVRLPGRPATGTVC
jgi:hypothetical protein